MQYINYDYKKGQPQSLYLNEAGLYTLMIRSRMKAAEQFSDWITHEVLPSIRKYGPYKLKKELEEKFDGMVEKINFLEKENKKVKQENKKMENDLKKEKYPTGALVYAIDYSTEDEEIYRIGMTRNMKTRKRVHDTHNLHNHKVVVLMETTCPIKLESCIRSMLYDYRYKNKKDFYICNIKKIKRI